MKFEVPFESIPGPVVNSPFSSDGRELQKTARRTAGRWAKGLAAALLLLAAAPAVHSENSSRLRALTSWIGNSYPGRTRWVQQDIHGLAVTGNGTVYANTFWDEGTREVGVYRQGKVIGMAGHTHGWGVHGGQAIAFNRKYVFIGEEMDSEGGHLKDPGTWPPKGKRWYGVSRRLRSDIRRAAPFAFGKGGKGDTLKRSFLVVNEVPIKAEAPVTGLAADAHHLYVCTEQTGEVRVYNAETMRPEDRWSLPRAQRLVLDRDGTLWVLQAGAGSEPARIVHLSTKGKAVGKGIRLPRGMVPANMCLSPRHQLLVADNGADQQIKVYGRLEDRPKQVGAFGRTGGIFSGVPGRFGNLKFNDPEAVGTDAAGNIYVASDGSTAGGGTVLESYTSKGSLNWRLFGLEFVDMGDLAPTSADDLYTKEEHFKLDFAASPGKQWRYIGYTVDRFAFPEDPRLHLSAAGAWVRNIDGKRFLFVNDMYSSCLQGYRFDPKTHGEVAIPSVLFAKGTIKGKKGWPPHQPAKGEWIWRDANGNGAFDPGEYEGRNGKPAPDGIWGWWIDSKGDVWQASEHHGIRRSPVLGLDANGNPIYDYQSMTTCSMPKPFTQLERLYYFPGTDTMYLSGYTRRHPHDHGMWKVLGRVICRYDHWRQGNRQARWEIHPPYVADSTWNGKLASMSIAGRYLFVVYTVGGRIEVYDTDTGREIGYMRPDKEVGQVGWVDIPQGIEARRLSDGSFIILVEEDAKAKLLMYQWRPESAKSVF